MRINVEEKLAAILVADVADYESLTAHDPGAAQAALQLCYHEVIDTAIAVYGGRIFELEPESMRAEFASPLAAVCCAVEIQETLAGRMAHVPPLARIRLRIGIHYGAATVDRGELTGEAPTIAGRVHGVTQPGEICVSRTVVEAVKGKVEHEFADLAAMGRAVPKAGLAFRLKAVSDPSGGMPAWLGDAGRLALTAVLAAALIWLALTEGRPGP
jgi:adenylate cyclase